MAKKERKLSKGQGIHNLKKVLESRGIATDLIDLNALYDSNLTYAENKENILREIGQRADPEEAEALIQEIEYITDRRTPQAQAQDSAIRARRTYKITNVEGAREWTKKPNRIDLEGIDAFTSSKKINSKGGKK